MYNENYSIIFSSMTGNTRKLADKIHEVLPKESCDYFGTADAQGTESELLYIGFWTDKGNADSDTLDFISKLKNKKIFLFGTAGFGGSDAYFQRILGNVKMSIDSSNKKKNARGGMLSYAQAVTDLELLRKMKMDGEYERHVFTTMFDLYALPDDFPGYEAAKAIGEPYARVAALETAFAEAINDSRFIPYIQLHEFEALLFCGIDYLAKRYPGCEKRCEQLKKDLEKTSNPELINNSPETAPSKRIIKAIEGDKKQHYNYNKPATGKDVTKSVGMDELRARCSHLYAATLALISKPEPYKS